MDDRAAPDLITVEIVHNTFKSVTDEMFVALMKSSYSTNIKERRDHSTAIIDSTGRLIAQAIAYLASPRSSSTTGTLLPVDGGFTGLRLPS